MSRCMNKSLILRIKERIFYPLLENNKTPELKDDSEDEKSEENKNDGKWIDGGKLPPKTIKELNKLNS
jgi:hypothetical protein